MPRGPLAPGTGEWIRSHLLKVREDYVYSVWKQYREHVKGRYKAPTYENFRRYVNLLKKLGLIIPIRVVVMDNRPNWSRTYYKVVAGKENNPAWRNPYKYRGKPR